MDVEFCIEALEDAIAKFWKPAIFNTDQGSQFTSLRFTGVLKDNKIKISMDGKGRHQVSIPPQPRQTINGWGIYVAQTLQHLRGQVWKITLAMFVIAESRLAIGKWPDPRAIG